MLQRFLFITLTLCSLSATAQWQQTGSKVRYVNGLGIPTKDTAAGVSADSSQIVIRPADSALYIKYKRTWLRVGGGGGSIAGGGTAGQVSFFTGASAISGDSALFWDNTNKRLGIHTKNPGKNLDVHGTNVIAQLNGTGTNNAYLDFQRAGSTQWRIGNQYAAAVNRFSIFNAAGTTENLTILQDGKVGVATPTPTTALQVGDGTGNPEITASGLNYDVVLGTPSGTALGFTTVGNYVGVYSNSATKDLAFTHGNGRAITFGTGNQTRLTITASGRILANTTDNGGDNLQVGGSVNITSAAALLTLNSTAANQARKLYFRDIFGGASSESYIVSSSKLHFGAGGASRIDMTLTAGANLLINTTTDNGVDKLQVSGSGRFTAIDNSTSTIATFIANNETQATDIWYGGLRAAGSNANVNLNLASKGTGIVAVTGAATFSNQVISNASGNAFFAQNGLFYKEREANGTGGTPTFEVALGYGASSTTYGSFQFGNEYASNLKTSARIVLHNGTAAYVAQLIDGGTGAATFSSSVEATQFKLSALNTAPSSANDTGTLGEIRIDANYIYICTATNTWKRVAIATW